MNSLWRMKPRPAAWASPGLAMAAGIAGCAAVAYPELGGAVPFYGRQPAAEDVAKDQMPLLIHYAGLDERVNEGWPAYEAALKAAGTRYEAFIYEGVNHGGFHNDDAALRQGSGYYERPGMSLMRDLPRRSGPNSKISGGPSANCQMRQILTGRCPAGPRACQPMCSSLYIRCTPKPAQGFRLPLPHPPVDPWQLGKALSACQRQIGNVRPAGLVVDTPVPAYPPPSQGQFWHQPDRRAPVRGTAITPHQA